MKFRAGEEEEEGSVGQALRYLSSLCDIPRVPDRLITEFAHLLPELVENLAKVGGLLCAFSSN